jgi:hypothetical protein
MIVLQATRDIRKVSLWLGQGNMATTETMGPPARETLARRRTSRIRSV